MWSHRSRNMPIRRHNFRTCFVFGFRYHDVVSPEQERSRSINYHIWERSRTVVRAGRVASPLATTPWLRSLCAPRMVRQLLWKISGNARVAESLFSSNACKAAHARNVLFSLVSKGSLHWPWRQYPFGYTKTLSMGRYCWFVLRSRLSLTALFVGVECVAKSLGELYSGVSQIIVILLVATHPKCAYLYSMQFHDHKIRIACCLYSQHPT